VDQAMCDMGNSFPGAQTPMFRITTYTTFSLQNTLHQLIKRIYNKS